MATEMLLFRRLTFGVAVAAPALAVAFSVASTAAAAPAEPLQTYDEGILAAVVIEKCHLKIDGEPSKEKMAAIGKAAFSTLRAELDEKSPGDRDKNGDQAEFLLRKRTQELVFSTYPKLIDQPGCAALEERARKAILTFIQ